VNCSCGYELKSFYKFCPICGTIVLKTDEIHLDTFSIKNNSAAVKGKILDKVKFIEIDNEVQVFLGSSSISKLNINQVNKLSEINVNPIKINAVISQVISNNYYVTDYEISYTTASLEALLDRLDPSGDIVEKTYSLEFVDKSSLDLEISQAVSIPYPVIIQSDKYGFIFTLKIGEKNQSFLNNYHKEEMQRLYKNGRNVSAIAYEVYERQRSYISNKPITYLRYNFIYGTKTSDELYEAVRKYMLIEDERKNMIIKINKINPYKGSYRQTNCYRCTSFINTKLQPICYKCNKIMCTKCGACMCEKLDILELIEK